MLHSYSTYKAYHLLPDMSALSCRLYCTTALQLDCAGNTICLPAGMVIHGCQELAASAVQGFATGAVFTYGALVANTVQATHVVRMGVRLYVFYVAAGTEWVWATTYATAENAIAALRTATLMVGFFIGWQCTTCAQCLSAAHVWQAALQHAVALLWSVARVLGYPTGWQCCMLAHQTLMHGSLHAARVWQGGMVPPQACCIVGSEDGLSDCA